MASTVTTTDNHQALTAFDNALESARRYANKSRADSTWRAYESDIARFQQWCKSVDRSSLPADTETVAAFLAAEADAGKAVSTIRRRLAAIRLIHIANDLPSPHQSIKVTDVLKGITRKNRDSTSRQAKPALDTDIIKLVDALDVTTLAGKRNRALLLVGFDAALRRSELVAITIEHIEKRKTGWIITIPYSKTDQSGAGAEVALLARPDSPYCPVAALEHWLTAAKISSGAIFRRCFNGGAIGDTPLSARSVSLTIKSVAKKAGYDISEIERFSGHSLRRGFITSVAHSGQGLLPIMNHTRHKKTDSVIGYVDSADRLIEHPGLNILN